MGSPTKGTDLLIVIILITSSIIFKATTIDAQSQLPSIEWQKVYGGSSHWVSNLIQTSDGGYAFMDLGWTFQGQFLQPTIYKLNSTGDVEWSKTINFQGSTIIQTSDGGYEISGHWLSWTDQEPNAVVKTDAQGNIQWNINYSSPTMVPNLNIACTKIKTSDGGFAYVDSSKLAKTDSNNRTVWSQSISYTEHTHIGPWTQDNTYPAVLSSLIETSDGALAAIGVGQPLSDNYRTGSITIIKTKAFLPAPSPSELPTPQPTPIVLTPTPTSLASVGIGETIWASIIFGIILLSAVIVFSLLLLYRRHRKMRSN